MDKGRGLSYNGGMKGFFGWTMGVLAAVTLVSCSEKGGREVGVRGTIAVSLLTLENPFFKIIGDHLAAEARAQGFEVLVVSADKDMAKQGNQVKDFIVKGVDAIVLSPCDPKSVVPVIQEANAAGIPVFTVDIPCPDPAAKVVTQFATDNYGGGPRDIGYRAAEDALQAHPDLRGIFAINDPSALGARAALEKAKKADQVTIIGFDGMREGKVAIKEGKVYADPIQFPDRMGVEIVKAFVKWSRGEVVPPEILIPTKLYRKADGEGDADLK